MVGVLNVGWQRFENGHHDFVQIAGDKFSWATACRNNGSAGIVQFVDFRFEVDS